jgi:hypothetical protein
MKVRICLSILVIGLLAATAASAQLLTPAVAYDFENPSNYLTLGGASNIPGSLTSSWDAVWSVPQFNPSLGTLQYVIITYQGAWQGQFFDTNGDATQGHAMSGSQTVVLNLDAGYTSGSTLSPTSYTQTLASMTSGSGNHNFGFTAAGTNTSTYTWSGNSTPTPITSDISTNLLQWEGTGTNNVLGDLGGSTTASGGPDATYTSSAIAGADFTIQYEYGISSPEPSTFGLGAMCLLGLGIWKRRRSQA